MHVFQHSDFALDGFAGAVVERLSPHRRPVGPGAVAHQRVIAKSHGNKLMTRFFGVKPATYVFYRPRFDN
jgi:hypothetical protein